MEYIQTVFMKVQAHMRHAIELNKLIDFLDSEPIEFRSVAYESASMEIGLNDLINGRRFSEWKKFYQHSNLIHSVHIGIGLGLAFAKAEITLTPSLELLDPRMQWMVFDGIGYYYGLFKGRRTVKYQKVPEFISGEQLKWFDQGLGRRLWYICKGQAEGLTLTIQSFPLPRQSDLWRGAGIACGYVGGSEKNSIEDLVAHSSTFKQHLCAGVALAAYYRSFSESVTDDVNLACQVVCGMPLDDVLRAEHEIIKLFIPIPKISADIE